MIKEASVSIAANNLRMLKEASVAAFCPSLPSLSGPRDAFRRPKKLATGSLLLCRYSLVKFVARGKDPCYMQCVHGPAVLLHAVCTRSCSLATCSVYTVLQSCYMQCVHGPAVLLHAVCTRSCSLATCSVYTVLQSCYMQCAHGPAVLLHAVCTRSCSLATCSVHTVLQSCYMQCAHGPAVLLHAVCTRSCSLATCSVHTVLQSCYTAIAQYSFHFDSDRTLQVFLSHFDHLKYLIDVKSWIAKRRVGYFFFGESCLHYITFLLYYILTL